MIEVIEDRDFSVNVISKSGTTTEPAIAFRVFKELLVEKYGQEEANKRIYATTDKAKGAVKVEADAEGWETFVIPDDIGGRFSVLTAVGLSTNRCRWYQHRSSYDWCCDAQSRIDFCDKLKKTKLTNTQQCATFFTVKVSITEILANYEP